MVRIGVLSDTHIVDLPAGLVFLQHLQENYFQEAGLILHAGDLVDPGILLGFAGATVYAVRGNLDPPAPELPARRILTLGGFRIGLIHGWGGPDQIESRILREFQGDQLDCLVYGHSHQPVCHRKDGILLFNPGSATDRRWAPFHSVGLLEIGATIEGRILRIDD